MLSKDAGLKTLPRNEFASAFERLRRKHEKDAAYLALIRERQAREQQLQQTYPRLFLTNKEIQAAQRAARKKLANEPEFKTLIKETAEAVREQRDYVIGSNETLRRLHKQLFDN